MADEEIGREFGVAFGAKIQLRPPTIGRIPPGDLKANDATECSRMLALAVLDAPG